MMNPPDDESRTGNEPEPSITAEQKKILDDRWRAFISNHDEGEPWEEVKASLFSR